MPPVHPILLNLSHAAGALAAARPASSGSAAAGWVATLLLLAALLAVCCYKRRQLRAAMQASGMAPKRAKIDPNAFVGVGADAAVEAQTVASKATPGYCYGRKRLASVVPQGAAAADATDASSGCNDETTRPVAVSPTGLATKSLKGIRDAVIQRSGAGGSALLSDADPRSDANARTANSKSAAVQRAQKARSDWFKRLFPNSHARLKEEKAAGGQDSSGRAASSENKSVDKAREQPGKGGIGGGLIATRL